MTAHPLGIQPLQLPSTELLNPMPVAFEALASASQEFCRAPNPDAAEILASRFSGAARHLLQIRSALLAESRNPKVNP